MPTLKTIVEDSSTIHGRRFDLAIQLLIAVSIVGFSIETLPGLSPFTKQLLKAIEGVTVGIFTIEYTSVPTLIEWNQLFILSFSVKNERLLSK